MAEILTCISGIISMVLSIFPENSFGKIVLVSIGVIVLIAACIFHARKSSKIKKLVQIPKEAVQQKTRTSKVTIQQRPRKKPLELSSQKISILIVFRINDGELASIPLIEHHTGLERIVINSILDEFVEHKLINATNLDVLDDGWLYQLTTQGRKTVLKFTQPIY